MEGHGFVNYWGFSPCLDLQEEFDGTAAGENVNVLLMGSGDIRHVFKTIALAHRHPHRQLNLYLIEGSLDSLARHILFLKLICEPVNTIGMRERAEMFLEMFGNLLIRPITARYIQKAAQKLILMITNLDYQADELAFLDLTQLRFKERDALESIFKIWNKQQEINFNTCWDVRLRRHLDLQYDSREGAFDWDYNMKLIDRGAGIIHTSEYKKWRRSGMAFELRDADYSVPNYSLLSPIVINDSHGDKHARLGYWGDVVVGPFLSFGVECEDKSFFKKQNMSYNKKSQDISVHNVLAFLYELFTHKKYEEAKNEDLTRESGPVACQINKFAKITFLPSKLAANLHKKAKFESFFDLVYFSNSMNHFFTPEITATFKNGAKIIMESAKFLLDLKMEKIKSFQDQINKMAQDAHCQAVEGQPEDVFLSYIYVQEFTA